MDSDMLWVPFQQCLSPRGPPGDHQAFLSEPPFLGELFTVTAFTSSPPAPSLSVVWLPAPTLGTSLVKVIVASVTPT